MRLKDMAMWIYKMAAKYNYTTVRSTVPENPTLETNMKSIGWRVTEIYGHLKFFKMAAGRHLEFVPTGNGAVRSAVPENPILEPNMKGIGWRVAELWPFEIFQYVWIGLRSVVGRSYRRSSFVRRWSVGRRSSIFILLTLISYTPLSLR